MEDKRLVNRIIAYWNSLRKDALMPQWEKVNVAAIDDIWQQCCAWRVDTGNNDTYTYTYQYVGRGVKEVLGVDPTGIAFTSYFRNFPGERIVRRMDDVVKTLSPIEDSTQFVNDHNKIIKCRSCLLPFGNMQGRVTHIVLALSWKAF